MPKSSSNNQTAYPDLLEPKVASDEIERDSPTKSELKKAALASGQEPDPSVMKPTLTAAPGFGATSSGFVPPSTTTAPGLFGTTSPGFVPPSTTTTPGFGSTTPSFAGSAPQPTNAYQQQANADLDKQIATQQLEKENEHWVKAYWRPAMGWLYMIICGMDFVGFPLLTIFLPVIFQPFGLVVPYQVWTSLTLSNGGLIHLSFGAILGVAAFTRGQEKMGGKS